MSDLEPLYARGRAIAHRAVTEGVNLKYLDVLRRVTYELADALEKAEQVKEALVNGAGELVECGVRAEACAAAAIEALRALLEASTMARYPLTKAEEKAFEQAQDTARQLLTKAALASAGAQQEPPPPPEKAWYDAPVDVDLDVPLDAQSDEKQSDVRARGEA